MYILIHRSQNENLRSTLRSASKEPLLSSPEKKLCPVIPAYADIHTRYVAALDRGALLRCLVMTTCATAPSQGKMS